MENLRKVLCDIDISDDLLKFIVARLTYASFVNEKKSFLFIETPKAACSTMKRIIVELDDKVVPMQYVKPETSMKMSIHNRKVNPMNSLNDISVEDINHLFHSKDVTRFCIVRNPYARLASAWSDKIRQREPGYEKIWFEINHFNNQDKNTNECPSFEDFVNWVVLTNDINNCNIHWRSLKALLLPDVIDYTHLLKTENLVDDFQQVLDKIEPNSNATEYLNKFRTNESLPVDWKELYTEEIAKLVYDFYKDDFTFYDYDENSWLPNKLDILIKDNQIDILTSKLNKLEKIALEAIRNRNDVISYLSNQKNTTMQSSKKTVLVVGDSHTKVFKHKKLKKITPNIDWELVSVEGATLTGLENPNSKTQAMPVFKWALKEKKTDAILFQLGEVDLGFVIWYKHQKNEIDIEEAFLKALSNYKELLIYAQNINPNIIVLSTCLPTIKDEDTIGVISNARREVVATQIERTDLSIKFNLLLEEWCLCNQIEYINLDNDILDDNGIVNDNYLNIDKTDHHYNVDAFINIINKKVLPTIRKIIWK